MGYQEKSINKEDDGANNAYNVFIKDNWLVNIE